APASGRTLNTSTAAGTGARPDSLTLPRRGRRTARSLDLLVGRTSMTGNTFRTGSLLVAAIALALGCGQGAQDTAAVTSAQEAVHKQSGPTLTPQNSGTTNSLISISALNARVAWASGRNGTFTRTTDGGKTWHAGVVPGAEALQFRDVQAVSEK